MSWDSVVRVRRRPRLVRGTIAVTVLQSSDGREIPEATPGLLRYAEFIDEVRKRATKCRSFEYYVSRWDR